ncbi:hypothetical protein TCAL_02809 [Tigriopus californicus]|uniref:Ig-like domain-containing protein n=1 Tax=Tigriopus californicus TaxID=6832 RepID=A0A553NZE5_TIGCA|nr:hypothetical protein TCAL_02809 [Tigriopus californicus]|eukprot:TCALIF_02809-PA protein Name:"Similar to sls Titin (Drosophila melanogaster)" AED:0.17 eAED:0.19 QI:0/-1/0/1/-1/1/1/0/128
MESWSAPIFKQPFQGTRFQQGDDAQFSAVISAEPDPEVSWAKNGSRIPPNHPKYQIAHNPSTGLTLLMIREFGPGDEGQYTLTAKNPYGQITATLNLNPDPTVTRSKAISNLRMQIHKHHQQPVANTY